MQLAYYIERAITFSSTTNSKAKSKIIVSSSAISLEEVLRGVQIDLAITSPPYIKAIDYIYNQMVELFWIGNLFEMQSNQNKILKNIIILVKNRFIKQNIITSLPMKQIFL